MKKFMILLQVAIVAIFLSSCFVIPYQGERPDDYPGTKWTSVDPDIWVEVGTDLDYNVKIYLPGKLVYNDNAIDIVVSFDYQDSIDIYQVIKINETEEDMIFIFEGTCTFGPDRLVVKLSKEQDFFNGQYEEIIFIRTDLDN